MTEAPDWVGNTRPHQVADTLLSVNVAAGVTLTQVYDVTQYQSVAGRLAVIGNVQDYAMFTFTFWDATQQHVVAVYRIPVVSCLLGGSMTAAQFQLPVRGPLLEIDVTTLNTITANVQVVASSIPTPTGPSIQEGGINPPYALVDTTGFLVTSGSTIEWCSRPTNGRLRFFMPGTVAATGVMTVILYWWNNATWQQLYTRFANLNTSTANRGDQTFDLDVPWGVPLKVAVTNNDTVSRTPGPMLIDLSAA